MPNAADITARKAEKILKEAVAVIENEDISRATEYILDAVALGQYSATQIAAAFMKMRLGDEIEDIRTEKFFFERKPRNGRGGKSDGGRSGRGGKNAMGSVNKGNKSSYGAGERSGRGKKGGYGEKGGYTTAGEKKRDKNRYAGAKPKDVRRDGSAAGRREPDYEPRYGGLRIKTKTT